jgi:hypothetical protein
MKNSYTAKIEFPMPPPVVSEYVTNPWLFFNPMSHVVILKKITDDKWDMIFSPDVDQTKGNSFYGIMNGPTMKGKEINYNCESLGKEIKMNIRLNLSTVSTGTSLTIDWDVETSLPFFEKFKGENFSLSPEHMIKKHLLLRVPEMLSLINYREQGREYLLETVTLSGAKAIPYIKTKAQEIKNCIVIGTSKTMKFTINVLDEQLSSINAESGNRETFGGEAILDILNNTELIDIGIYDSSAENQIKELVEKQYEKTLSIA